MPESCLRIPLRRRRRSMAAQSLPEPSHECYAIFASGFIVADVAWSVKGKIRAFAGEKASHRRRSGNSSRRKEKPAGMNAAARLLPVGNVSVNFVLRHQMAASVHEKAASPRLSSKYRYKGAGRTCANSADPARKTGKTALMAKGMRASAAPFLNGPENALPQLRKRQSSNSAHRPKQFL